VAASKPSKDHQEQASTLLHAYCWWQKILTEDPKVLLAAELGSSPWRLQERSHGASVRAPSQQGAQSGCWQRPRQLVNVGLDSSKKAEAACPVRASSKPTSLAFLGGTAIPPRYSQIFLGTSGKWNRKKQLAKIKFCFIGRLRTSSETSFNGCFEKRVQKDDFANRLKCNWARKPS
jgi:hypothetical protein